MTENFFITAIDTDSGKTLVSAIFCQCLGADYWKPVQAGLPRDTDVVKSLVTNSSSYFHSETYLLNTPASPHAAAKIDGVAIELSKIKLPRVSKSLIIEGAGGCMVPLNENDFMIDLIKKCEARVVIVSDLYLGSINHTLLTFEALSQRNISIAGIVFNGDSNPESERIILKHTNVPCLLRIPRYHQITTEIVDELSRKLKL